MKEIKNKYNYHFRCMLIIVLLVCTLIVPFLVYLPEGLLLGIPAFLVFFRLFIYVNITQHISVGAAYITVTSYKMFFLRRMVIPVEGIKYRLVPIKSSKGTSHCLEIIKDGRTVYEVYNSEGFSKADFEQFVAG